MQSEPAIRVTTTRTQLAASPILVVMAKPPVPGRVKTRLIGALTAEQAAEVHAAMLKCVLARLASLWPCKRRTGLILAMNGAADWPIDDHWDRLDQGTGDLGQRIGYVWQVLGGEPAAFFGTDSPDIPADLIGSVASALNETDAALGPVLDGGYWTVAARKLCQPMLTGIDWGTDRVYHQSLVAAEHAGLKVARLEPWHDVDSPADLTTLRHRIANSQEPPLAELRRTLDQICKDIWP